MASPSGRSPGHSISRELPSGRSSTIPSPPRRFGIAPRRGSVPSRQSSIRSWSTTRPIRPSSGTPLRNRFVDSATSTGTLAVTPRCNATCSSIAADIKKPSSLWDISRASASRSTSAISTSISPTAGGRFLSWSTPGPTQRPLRAGAALRAHRGDPRRRGRGLRVLWRRAQGGLLGQPSDGRHTDPPGTNASFIGAMPSLATHSVFDPLCCMPARGNEQPDAEGTVTAFP